MLRISFVALLVFFSILVNAQVNKLIVELPGVVNQPLYISNYEGDKSRIVDTITTDADGKATAQLDKKVYREGLYKAIIDYDNFIEFIVTDENIHIKADIADISNTVEVITSEENIQYYSFLRAHNAYHQKVSVLQALIDNYPDEKFKANAFKEYEKANAKFEKQISKLESKAKPFTVALSKARIEIAPDLNIPAYNRHEKMCTSYFDNLDLTDSSLYYSDAYTQKAIGYISMYVSIVPEQHQIAAFKVSVDDILLKMSESKMAYDVVAAYLISGFGSMQLTELVDYITDNYILERGCIDADELSALRRKVLFHSKMKVGDTIKPLVAETLLRSEINSANFKDTPLVLAFWSSSCDYSTKEMTQLASLFSDQKERTFELAMISLDTVISEALAFITKNGMSKHYNICDEKGWNSNFVEQYNIYSTPIILVIQNGEVIAKPKDYESLRTFLEVNGFIKRKASANEGTITFKITYKEEEKEAKPIIDLLPTEMTQYFKNERSRATIEGFMGMFMAAYISNNETKENTTLFKVMTDKHFCSTGYGAPSVGFDDFSGMKIEHTSETKIIAGKKATKAIVTFENNEMPSFEIYYTDEIKIPNPNWHTPYKEIDKVLLEFVVRLKGITMHLEATSIANEPVDDDEFIVPEDFNEVEAKELNRRIDDIIDNANY